MPDKTTSANFYLHYPTLGEVARCDSGAIRANISNKPVYATVFFADLDAAEDFVLALGREILALRMKSEVTS